jgi:hypothetical protein
MSDRLPNRAGDGTDLVTGVGLVIAAVLVLSGFLLYQAVTDRVGLLATIANQQQPLHQAEQVKRQLTALAGATAKLAEQGDAGAKAILEAMQRQGINIKP